MGVCSGNMSLCVLWNKKKSCACKGEKENKKSKLRRERNKMREDERARKHKRE
jgi:hypothetical protein